MSKRLFSPQAFLERTRPLLGGLYQVALLITDNAEAAETALRQALVETYLSDTDPRDRRALRERMRRETRSFALEQRREQNESEWETGDWRGVAGTTLPEESATLFSHFSQEDRRIQRLLLLRFGCGFPAARAAVIADMPGSQASEAIAAFRARSASAGREAWERTMARMCRRLVEEPGGAPDMSAVCRAFERDAVGNFHVKRKRRNIPGIIFCVIGVALCALLFWLIAILLEPSHAPQEAEEAAALARLLRWV